MSGDTLKRVKSVKRWLEKAENSYSNHKELTGEMNLIMAQAEMQRLKEVRGTSPRRKWLLRGGALAVAGALFLGASFLKDSFFAPAPTPVRPVETAVTTPDAAVVPVEEADKKAEEVPSVSAETVTTEPAETDPPKPDSEAVPPAKAAPVVMTPAPAPVEVSAVTKPEVPAPGPYTHLRAHETQANLVCRLPLEQKKKRYVQTGYMSNINTTETT